MDKYKLKGKRNNRTCGIFIPNPSNAFESVTSVIGAFLASEKVRWRKSVGALKVRVSMSSEPAAYT